jgi:hypothetical protein
MTVNPETLTKGKKMEMQELTFAKEKETKNTVRYQEVSSDGAATVIGPLYIQKSALGAGIPPEITMTIGVAVTN